MTRWVKRDLPKHTCPLIDKAIADIRRAINSNTLEDVYHWLDGVEDTLEEIRDSNETLRDAACDVIDERDELEMEIENLKETV